MQTVSVSSPSLLLRSNCSRQQIIFKSRNAVVGRGAVYIVQLYRRFREMCCHHFNPQEEESMFLRNVSKLLSNNYDFHPRRHLSSS
jgi:hypothetical protein